MILTKSNEKEKIKEQFEHFIQAVNSKDADETIKYLSPKLFDSFSKKTYLGLTDIQYEESFLTPEKYEVKNISEIVEKESIKYSKVTYVQNYSMDLAIYKTIGNVDVILNQISTPLDKQFGKENVVFNEDSFKLEIKASGHIYAILDISEITWKFFTDDDMIVTNSRDLLPNDVKEKI